MLDLSPIVKLSDIQMFVWKLDRKKPVYGPKCPVCESSAKSCDSTIWTLDTHTVWYSDESGIQVSVIQIQVSVIQIQVSGIQMVTVLCEPTLKPFLFLFSERTKLSVLNCSTLSSLEQFGFKPQISRSILVEICALNHLTPSALWSRLNLFLKFKSEKIVSIKKSKSCVIS